MKTQAQLRTELYNALYGSTTLPNEIYWVGRPEKVSSYPCLVYNFLSNIGGYAFQDGLVSEDVQVQIDIYTEVYDKTNMDGIINILNTVMWSIGYRNINQTIELLESDTQKLMKPTRWEKINV